MLDEKCYKLLNKIAQIYTDKGFANIKIADLTEAGIPKEQISL